MKSRRRMKDGCMNGWNGWMDVWMGGWLYEWMDGCMNGWMDGWMDGWLGDWWMDQWMDGWAIVWTNGWTVEGINIRIDGMSSKWMTIHPHYIRSSSMGSRIARSFLKSSQLPSYEGHNCFSVLPKIENDDVYIGHQREQWIAIVLQGRSFRRC